MAQRNKKPWLEGADNAESFRHGVQEMTPARTLQENKKAFRYLHKYLFLLQDQISLCIVNFEKVLTIISSRKY